MIEANEPTNGTVVKQETPERITTTQIIEDLENGINRDGIKEKYSLETWMVTQLFQHPKLKGKKAKKIRKLPFQIIDDTVEEAYGVDKPSSILDIEATIDDPNQTVIEIDAVTSFEEEDSNEFNNY
jgi:hypothetical protein